MKTLTGLTAQSVTDTGFQLGGGHHATVIDEPTPGLARVVRMSPAGLLFERGSACVAIPMSDLLRLAESAEPGFRWPVPNLPDTPA